MKKVPGFIGRIAPRRGNGYGRKHAVTLKTRGSELWLTIDNGKGTWSTDLVLDPAETAKLIAHASQHLADQAAEANGRRSLKAV